MTLAEENALNNDPLKDIKLALFPRINVPGVKNLLTAITGYLQLYKMKRQGMQLEYTEAQLLDIIFARTEDLKAIYLDNRARVIEAIQDYQKYDLDGVRILSTMWVDQLPKLIALYDELKRELPQREKNRRIFDELVDELIKEILAFDKDHAQFSAWTNMVKAKLEMKKPDF